MKPVPAILLTALCLPAMALAAGEAGPKGKKEPKVCRHVLPTGSHIEQRLCLTVDEWIARAERDSDSAETLALRHRERNGQTSVAGGH